MDIERDIDSFPYRLHHQWPEGNHRHKFPVHDVEVDVLSATIDGLSYLLCKVAHVCGEDGRGNNHGHWLRVFFAAPEYEPGAPDRLRDPPRRCAAGHVAGAHGAPHVDLQDIRLEQV